MLDILTIAALKAGREIMNVHKAGPHVTYKNDCSPVTEADQRAEDIILSALQQSFPGIPVIAEESAANGIVPETENEFFLVDPLDGTKEFVSGKDDFTVNIALIRSGVPVLGIVYAPALGAAWSGHDTVAEKLAISADYEISDRRFIRTRTRQANPVAVISRSHCTAKTEAFVAENGLMDSISIGSSLKFCMLAEGMADVYPRFSRTMLWDTAAGDAVLRAAGGVTLNMAGNPLTYHVGANPENALDNPDFIAWGAPPA
jgi:3'(2'), 5'-bisphosphate nucleotidase